MHDFYYSSKKSEEKKQSQVTRLLFVEEPLKERGDHFMKFISLMNNNNN